MKKLLALLLILTGSVFGQQTSGMIDSATGNLVYTTVNPPPQGADPFSWSGFMNTSSNGGGYSGGYMPGWNPNTGTFMFGYNQGTVSYSTPVNYALSMAGTNIQVNGFKYSWEYLNQDMSRGTLSANINLTNTSGQVLQNYNYNMPQTTGGWTRYSGTENFNTQYPASGVGNLNVSFTGKDDRWWAGYYGPQVRAIDVSLLYSVAAPPPIPTDFAKWIPLANENDSFTLTTAGVVRYGAQGTYIYQSFQPGTYSCSNSAWGNDPIGGVYKSCSLGSNTTTTPTVPKTTTADTTTTTTTDYSTVALLDPVTTTQTTTTTTTVADPIATTTPTTTTTTASSPATSQPSAVAIVSAPAPAPTTSNSSTTTSTTTQSSTKESSQSGGSTSLALSIISKNSDRDAAGAAVAQAAVAQAQAAANQAQQEAQSVASNAVSNSISAGQSAMKSESNNSSSRTSSSSSSQTENNTQNAGQINLVLGPTVNSNTNSSAQKQDQTTTAVAVVSSAQSNANTQTIQAVVVSKNDSNKSVASEAISTTTSFTLLPPQQSQVVNSSPLPTQPFNNSMSSNVLDQQSQITSIYSLVPPQPVLQLVVPTTNNIETLQQPVMAQQQSSQVNNTNETVAMLTPNMLTDKTNPLTDIVEGKQNIPQNNTTTMTGPVVNKNAQDNEIAGGVDINKMATSPTGYGSYLNLVLRDVAFYAPKEVYKNQVNVDNARALRLLTNDAKHKELVELQYAK